MILKTLIDDTILKIYKGSVSDDINLPRPQLLYWFKTQRDMIVKSYLDDLISKGKPIDTFYLERETCLVADPEEVDCVDDDDERIFVILDKQPLNLLNDMGVYRVVTNDNTLVLKSSIELTDIFSDIPYTKATPMNITYWRDSNKLIIEGLKAKSLPLTKFIVHYAPGAAGEALTEQDNLLVSGDLLPILMESVEQIARREIFGSQEDVDNNGVDDSKQTQ